MHKRLKIVQENLGVMNQQKVLSAKEKSLKISKLTSTHTHKLRFNKIDKKNDDERKALADEKALNAAQKVVRHRRNFKNTMQSTCACIRLELTFEIIKENER